MTHSVPVVINPPPAIELTEKEKKMPLLIYVDKGANAQMMRVFEKGMLVASFPVSTGREVGESNYKNPNFETYCSTTPVGEFKPKQMHDLYLSKQWGGSKMYNAMFFKGGYAIHGVDDKYYEHLGTRASGGCIRTTQENSKKIFDKVQKIGAKNTTIKIVDSSPASDQLRIAEDCENQMKVNQCAQAKLKKEKYYENNPPTPKDVNGETFMIYNIPREYAYEKEVECKEELTAQGALRETVRTSPRPKPRPAKLPIHYSSEPAKDAPF